MAWLVLIAAGSLEAVWARTSAWARVAAATTGGPRCQIYPICAPHLISAQDLAAVHEADTGRRGQRSRTRSATPEAYIHFVGVDPAERGNGLGRLLYKAFFVAAGARGAVVVRAVTSPANRGSIAFHQRMGFQLEPGDAQIGGIPVSSGHDGPDSDRTCGPGGCLLGCSGIADGAGGC